MQRAGSQSRPGPEVLPLLLLPYSLLCHVHHGLRTGVASSCEVVPVSLHADGLQPVLHGAHG